MNRQNDGDQGIDMSPLIDMVFILLIFFMVSTTFIKDKQVEMQRPGASSSKPASSQALRIVVDRHQNIYLNQQPVKAWSLQSRLREHAAKKKEVSVLLVTDKDVPVEKVIEVIDQTRLAGIFDIGIATDGESTL